MFSKKMPYERKLIATSNNNIIFQLLQISSQFQLNGEKTLPVVYACNVSVFKIYFYFNASLN